MAGRLNRVRSVSAGLEAWKVQQSYLEDAEGGRNQSGYGGAQRYVKARYQLCFPVEISSKNWLR